MHTNEMLEEIFNFWGMEKQLLMLIEEGAELQKAICKWKRGIETDRYICEIKDEVLDNFIVIQQLVLKYEMLFDYEEKFNALVIVPDMVFNDTLNYYFTELLMISISTSHYLSLSRYSHPTQLDRLLLESQLNKLLHFCFLAWTVTNGTIEELREQSHMKIAKHYKQIQELIKEQNK